MKKRRFSRKAGLPPGSAVYTGSKTGSTSISMIVYDDENFDIHENVTPDEVIRLQGKNTTNWVLVKGYTEPDNLQKLASHFEIHPLILEDIVNVDHMPKVEDAASGVFITLKNLTWNEKTNSVESEHLSMYLGANQLITFEESGNSVFEPIIDRLKVGKGRGRMRQEDYLCYLLIDHVVDNYFILLDHIEDQLDELEKVLIENPDDSLTGAFLNAKKNLMLVRKLIFPLKEELRFLSRGESALFSEFTHRYLNDVNDHLSFILQSVDSSREIIASMMDLLMANNANRMNSIMKTLTLVSTIFIPLTLLTGIYGMNFENMPELQWKFGYPVFMGSLVLLGAGMYIYMKSKKWF